MVEHADPKRVVADGYDRMGSKFGDFNAELPSEGRRWFLREVLAGLPEGSLVLELGCGPGTDARPLSEDRRYLGLDLSPVQLSIARQYASSGMFVCGDLTTTLFRPLTFDGIVAFYAFNHVPQRVLEQAFAASFECLRSGGYLMLAALPTFKDEDRVEEWLGVHVLRRCGS
jgi:SAM-dependent methyltransferase